ncbi:uncharacterized protein LOC109118604 [Fukomys damarensis]|uniref:uncharacterized protein LOC109118604 n=1 Tax=Fukomys damarensis TaxID=885580 RepID=UPI0008FF1C9B|nr:uncharacterized protein LOC109118604 [Fukomys damarensis]
MKEEEQRACGTDASPAAPVSEPQAAHSPLEKPPSTAILCSACGSLCKGEVLRVQDKYFHIKCFVCKACGCDLAEGGFFVRQGEYICTQDFQRLYGTRCCGCERLIQGEVVSALPFPPGDRVTFNGKECVCQKCSLPTPVGSGAHIHQGLRSCGGCGLEIKNGQALVALDKHWHVGCFKCKTCGKQLNAEYISKYTHRGVHWGPQQAAQKTGPLSKEGQCSPLLPGIGAGDGLVAGSRPMCGPRMTRRPAPSRCREGLPYCETDYHTEFGIRCSSCEGFITGRVLEAHRGQASSGPFHMCCQAQLPPSQLCRVGQGPPLEPSGRRMGPELESAVGGAGAGLVLPFRPGLGQPPCPGPCSPSTTDRLCLWGLLPSPRVRCWGRDGRGQRLTPSCQDSLPTVGGGRGGDFRLSTMTSDLQ